ncbi:hypothetical protein M728_004271 (plasmid) [Ensifer sp. WSM1721]|uniref:hypothetical protein n=1 Tax=Ensifer sp. WSM1721 TaxID=1041159 RepID=UPI0004AFAA94|nr:hypothetical protein [Ensifer sp. WSM1721]
MDEKTIPSKITAFAFWLVMATWGRGAREAAFRRSSMPPTGANLFLVKQRGCRDVQAKFAKRLRKKWQIFPRIT